MSKTVLLANLPEFWPAPAKINLMLHITGRREDGYHELQTVFQFIDYADRLSFNIRNDGVIARHSDNFSVPQDQDIIIRAAKALCQHYLTRHSESHTAARTFGVDIELVKKIPMGAGLGGGSSDAATTLLVLNKLWQMSFSIDELADIGLTLGADVPVFIRGFAAFAEGVGEKIRMISPPEKWYLLLIPPVHISTKEIFCNPELTRDTSAIKICDLSRHQWRNDCTPVVVKYYPEVAQAIDFISKYSKASMSGTGASVFAGFDTEAQADAVLKKIKENSQLGRWICFVAKGLNRSPLHHLL